MMRASVVSGGQTGVDRAALDVAVKRSIPYSGWCPSGGIAEDFADPPGLLAKYVLRPTPSDAYEQRTAWNVRDSHATLILVRGGGLEVSPGCLFTKVCAELIFQMPYRVVNLAEPENALAPTNRWIAALLVSCEVDPLLLNFAGPRESESPGIYRLAFDFIDELLA